MHMQPSLAVRWLAAALLALLALALPLKGAGADGLVRHGVKAYAFGTHLSSPGIHSRVLGRSGRARFESDVRHHLRRQALRRGHGAGEIVVLDKRALSGHRRHKVIVVERHAFPALHKGGIFGSQGPQTIILVQPHRIARRHVRTAGEIQPRKVIVHGGHGLFAHRPHPFGGRLGGHGFSFERHHGLTGAHPHLLVIRPRHR